MASRASDVVKGYATLASSLLDRWSTQASKVAAKVDAGTYDASSAAADLGAWASLATESSVLLAAEALDAASVLAGCEGEPNIVPAGPFRAPAGAALQLAEPLVRVGTLEELPVSVVTIEPAKLGPDETKFMLRADATGHRGGTYTGVVQASTGAPAPVSVDVWIAVP